MGRTPMLKYRDLPWELRDQVDFAYGHIQKAQNPTVKHILERLKKRAQQCSDEGAYKSAEEKHWAINDLEQHMRSLEL